MDESAPVATLSDDERQRIRSILARTLSAERDPAAAQDDFSVGVLYVDPPGVCIPIR